MKANERESADECEKCGYRRAEVKEEKVSVLKANGSYHQRHVLTCQLHNVLHRVPHHSRHIPERTFLHFQYQFVVDLQQQAALADQGAVRRGQGFGHRAGASGHVSMQVDHGELDEVCGRALQTREGFISIYFFSILLASGFRQFVSWGSGNSHTRHREWLDEKEKFQKLVNFEIRTAFSF
jgi:hypothetical protein